MESLPTIASSIASHTSIPTYPRDTRSLSTHIRSYQVARLRMWTSPAYILKKTRHALRMKAKREVLSTSIVLAYLSWSSLPNRSYTTQKLPAALHGNCSSFFEHSEFQMRTLRKGRCESKQTSLYQRTTLLVRRMK